MRTKTSNKFANINELYLIDYEYIDNLKGDEVWQVWRVWG